MAPADFGTPVSAAEQIIERLMASRNVCDNRKGVDLRELLALGRGPWRGRFQILRFRSTPEGGLAILCRLRVAGLIWSDGRPVPNDTFVCALGIPNSFPLTPPGVTFLGAVPWCGHVVHRDFVPDASRLPAFLQEYRRQGHGRCCYVRSAEWQADAGTLAIALWQVSRLVSFAKEWGEAGSLNPAARDHAQRLAKEAGRLPLGRPLPYPQQGREHVGDAAIGQTAGPEGSGDVEWTVEDAEVEPDAS